MTYQIQDKNGVIFSDYEFYKISLAWDINYLNDDTFQKKYNTNLRNPEWIITKYEGKLQLVCVMEEIEVNPDYKNLTYDKGKMY